MLYGDKYYLTVSFGKENVQFDKEEVTFVRPQYLYELHTMEDMENLDCLPVMKFDVTEGMFSISTTFITPVCSSRATRASRPTSRPSSRS